MNEDSSSIAYVVVMEGIYQQGIVAVSLNMDTAIKLAEDACAAEKDSYHQFVVYKRELDQLFCADMDSCWIDNKWLFPYTVATVFRKFKEQQVHVVLGHHNRGSDNW